MIRTVTLALVLAATACGGKQSAPATTTTTQTGETGSGGPHDGHMMHHEGMPAELTKFHDMIRPLWHAEKGPKRQQDTCAAAPQLQAEADVIAKTTPPTQTNADTWTNGTRALVAAVGELATACKGGDATAFEAAFTKVHDSFHALMMASGMKHEGMGGPQPHQHQHQHQHGDHKM